MSKPRYELTLRAVMVAIVLTILLAISNAYLALRLGLLTSASIPAAILSMGILRYFKHPSVLENNAIQTAASAGEAVAGGIVYTIPALILIQYWHGFDYLTNAMIAFLGGVLGVLFSIPLRRFLVHQPSLKFPEGHAIAEVLHAADDSVRFHHVVWGGIVGACMEFFQLGLNVLSSSWSYWLKINQTVFGVSLGFSATMVGAGYLIGQHMALSIGIGAIISWLFALPWISHATIQWVPVSSPEGIVVWVWEHHLRYFAIGAMLMAGGWTLIQLMFPLLRRLMQSQRLSHASGPRIRTPVTEQDIPLAVCAVLLCLVAFGLFGLLHTILPWQQAGFSLSNSRWLSVGAVAYVLLMGGFFSIITAYFSGMLGVTASPGSSIMIAGMLLTGSCVLYVVQHGIALPWQVEQLQAMQAITIIICAVLIGTAAIANDNTQDLKVGQLVGATPWKQQLMLLLGVMVSALVIPPVMQLLFEVYGIAGIMPHSGMEVGRSLPAPAAALLAAISDAVFQHRLPWVSMGCGGVVILILLGLDHALRYRLRLSVLGVAIGMYLPLSSSVPLFIGGLIARWVNGRITKVGETTAVQKSKHNVGTLLACGLVAGAALMDVLLAVVFSISGSQSSLFLVGSAWAPIGLLLSVLSMLLLAMRMGKRIEGCVKSC